MKRVIKKEEEEEEESEALEEDDIFYLPKKKRHRFNTVKPVVIDYQKEQQKLTTTIIDKPVSPVKIIHEERDSVQLIGSDIPCEQVSHISELEGKKENVLVTAYFAINLFLNPHTVYSTTLYWISQYVNYKKSTQLHWFTDHITKLMKYPVDFNMTATRGVSDFHSKEVKYNLLIHTIGSSLHKIPCEYFIIQSNESLVRSIQYLINPVNACFLTNQHMGLKGELEVASFVYNDVMNFLYEPSFFIITSYLIYTYQLFYATGGRDILDYMPILDVVIGPLRLGFKIGCLSPQSTNYENKMSLFLSDMKALLEVYESNAYDQEAIISGLKKLWCQKATYCHTVVPERYLALHKQIY